MTADKLLSEIYYSPGDQGAYSGAANLLAAFRKVHPDKKINKKVVEDFLSKQTPYSLHRKKYKKFPRNQLYFPRVNHQLSCDLIDFSSYSQYNDGFKFILIAIDGLSRYLYTEKLKTKKGVAITEGLSSVFKKCPELPKVLNSDRGKEFLANPVQQLLKSKNIHFFTSHGDMKAANAERVIQTVKVLLYRYFDKGTQRRWVDILPQLTSTYNKNYHRSIKMSPEEAQELPNAIKLSEQSYKKLSSVKKEVSHLQKGDIVRLNLNLGVLAKNYEQSWSRALYRVTSDPHYNVGGSRPMYEVSELNGEKFLGRFLPEEILKVDKRTFLDEYNFPIEKVVTKGKKTSKVKWLGYDNDHNSWVNNTTIKQTANEY